MKVVDLTHTIHSTIPVFPGTENPSIEHLFTIKENGFAESKLTIFSHAGTHMDSPGHMLEGAITLDQYAVDRFVGEACVLDFSKQASKYYDFIINLKDLKAFEAQISDVDFVLIYSGWSHKWKSEDYLTGFPTLSIEAAKWLVTMNLKGIGIDALSIDLMDTTTFPVHRIFMEKEMVIIENLMTLDGLVGKKFVFSALPLKYENADGAPVRAIATIYGIK